MRFVKCSTQAKFRICLILPETGWQKLGDRVKGLHRKVWTRTNIVYFVAILKFVAIYALFARLLAKQVFFGVKNSALCTSVSWARSALLYIYITYCTELNLQICNYVQKRHICHENSKYAPDENSYGHFCAPVSPSLADQILKEVMQGIPN